jgi:hypothetical protein
MGIRGLARLAALGVLFALAGCVTAENSLSQNDIASMKLTGVTVGFEPNADVSWEEGIRAYAIAKTIPDHEIASATNTPEAKAYIQNLLQPKIKAGVEQAMVGQLNGPRPVRLDVVVKRFAIASAVQRILIGGNHVMVATATLVDARTGAAIITYSDLVAQVVVGQGIVGTAVQAAIDSAMPQTTTERLIAEYGRSYRTWLVRPA